MSTPMALLEVLKELEAEARHSPEIGVPINSWHHYQQWQQMWNPNWSRAGELDLYQSSP